MIYGGGCGECEQLIVLRDHLCHLHLTYSLEINFNLPHFTSIYRTSPRISSPFLTLSYFTSRSQLIVLHNSTMIGCMITYDVRNAWNSCLLILPNAEWSGPERCIHEHIGFSSCNNHRLGNSCTDTKYLEHVHYITTNTDTITNDTLNC